MGIYYRWLPSSGVGVVRLPRRKKEGKGGSRDQQQCGTPLGRRVKQDASSKGETTSVSSGRNPGVLGRSAKVGTACATAPQKAASGMKPSPCPPRCLGGRPDREGGRRARRSAIRPARSTPGASFAAARTALSPGRSQSDVYVVGVKQICGIFRLLANQR
jgi:hypothetical protein